jgi:hypothetical protein
MRELIDDVAKYVAGWWTDRLMMGDKDAFRSFLERAVAAQLQERMFVHVECDYDPRDILLDAVRAAGVECRGMLFSARGILPSKHSTTVYPEKQANAEFDEPFAPARLVVKEGYGNWSDPIPLTDIPALLRAKEARAEE